MPQSHLPKLPIPVYYCDECMTLFTRNPFSRFSENVNMCPICGNYKTMLWEDVKKNLCVFTMRARLDAIGR